MYRLENNVEWTNELKDAFKHNIIRATIQHGERAITENNYLKNLQIKECRYVPKAGFIGQAVAKMATINLIDKDKNINLENEEVEIKIGAEYNGNTYYINYGKFIVNPAPENDQTTDTVKLIAYDYMIKFNKNYEDRVQYPCKLKDLLTDVCSQAGVGLGSEHFTNENFQVVDNQFEGKTLREVLQNIAKCAFSWARIGQDNKLYLDFEVKTQVDERLGVRDYKQEGYKTANEYYGAINVVTYGDSDIQGQEESKPDMEDILLHGEKEIVINDNYFAYTTSKRQELIQGGTHLWGLKYMPIQELKMIGLIYLDSNDIIEVEDLNGNKIKSYVFSHIIDYNGVISDRISTESESENEQIYENKKAAVSQNSKTEVSVDRANKKIQSIASEIGDRSEKTSTITQEIDRINSVVEEIEDLTDKISGLTQLTLQNCVAGELLELHIYGNNTVFKYLYPADDLYPSDTLFPYGDSRIVVTDSQGNEETIELGVTEVLRQNGEIRDEFILENNKAKIIRRILPSGEPRLQELIEYLPDVSINLKDGTNTIAIKNYEARLEAKFAIQNDYTDIFATKALMNSSITQTAEEINLEVRKKVDENEVISKINQSAEEISIEANKISLNGKTLNLADNMAIVSNKFNVDSNGNMRCSDATLRNVLITGNSVDLTPENETYEAINIHKPDNPSWQAELSWYNFIMDFNGKNVTMYNDGDNDQFVRVDNGGIQTIVYPDGVVTSSQEKQKKNFEKLLNSLEIIKNIDIYKYNYNFEKNEDKKHIGFVIGDKYKYSKEVTSKNNDGVDLYSFISVCCKAIQEQQEEIEELQNRIKEMEEKNGQFYK